MSSRYAVGFDFDHTLGIDNKLERTIVLETVAGYAREHGATYDAALAEGSVDEVLASYRVGNLTPEIALAGFLERFVPVAGAGVMDTANAYREAVVARARDFVEPVAGAREMLARLAEMHVPVAILTNGWSPLQEEKARLFGFSGPVFVSERIGLRKPDAQAFAFLAQQLEREAVDIFYVGDDPRLDCEGARAAGMHSVWFDWENKPYPTDLNPPDTIIHALAELPDLLQGRD